MNTHTTQQEILLITTSNLSQWQLCAKENSETNCNLSAIEQLEAACWNGLLEELLPELLHRTACGGRLFIWHIRQGASFLQIQLSDTTVVMDNQFSLVPSFFLPLMLATS
jgi:hypothetical protein